MSRMDDIVKLLLNPTKFVLELFNGTVAPAKARKLILKHHQSIGFGIDGLCFDESQLRLIEAYSMQVPHPIPIPREGRTPKNM